MKKVTLLLVILTLCIVHVFAQSPWLKQFTVESSRTYTIPAADQKGVSSVKAEAWGGGGAGGYVSGGWLFFPASGGGGGGAYAADIFELYNNSYAIYLNVGNAGANSSSNVTDGGDSYVNYPGVDGACKVKALGGKSVKNTNNTTGAQGGSATDCIGREGWKWSGGKGGNGSNAANGGGGGAAADACGNGGDGENSGSLVSTVKGGKAPDCDNKKAGDGGEGRSGTQSPASAPSSGVFGGGGGGAQSGVSGINVLRGDSRTGGSGAKGGVRLTYFVFYVDNVETDVCTGNSLTIDSATIAQLAGICTPPQTKYTWSYNTNSNITVLGNGSTANDKIEISEIRNQTNEIQVATFNCEAIYTDNLYGFGELKRTFTLTVNVYPTANGGKIKEAIVSCPIEETADTLKKFINHEDARGGKNGKYYWQYSTNGTDWVEITGANTKDYVPNNYPTSGILSFRRVWHTDCGVAYSNEISTKVGNVQAGNLTSEGSTEEGEYCYGTNMVVKLKANPVIENQAYQTDYSIQWQKKIGTGNWTDISGATNDTYEETFEFNTPAITDSIMYRYMFQFSACIAEASGNVYKQKLMVSNDYYSPILTNDVEITLYYSACDTAVFVPEFDPQPLSYSVSPARVGEGTTIVTWTIQDPCGGTLTYNQKYIVKYPECENPVEIDGTSYDVVRVGCDCWLAKNLTVDAGSSKYYNDDAANSSFGKLYSWYDALGVANGDNSASPASKESKTGEYIQGICPDGWAIPSVNQYNNLSNLAGGNDKLKSSDVSTWLPNCAGVEPVSGFNAVGAGYYDQQINASYKMLGVTKFWTSEVIEYSVKGICSRVDHSCPDIKFSEENKTIHISVRCVRIEPKE